MEQSGDLQVIQAIFRPIHSIKGNASFFGLTAIRGLAHDMETILDQARRGHRTIDGATSNLLLAGMDHLKEMLNRVGQHLPESADPQKTDTLRESLRNAIVPLTTGRITAPLALDAAAHHPIVAALARIDQGPLAVMPWLDQLPAWAANEVVKAAVAAFRAELDMIMAAVGWCEVVTDLLKDQLPKLREEHAWQSPRTVYPFITTPAQPLPSPALESKRIDPPTLLAAAPAAHQGIFPPISESTHPTQTRAIANSGSDRHVREDQAIRVPTAQIDGFLAQVGELLVLGDLLAHVEGRLAQLPNANDARRDLRQALGIYSQVTTGMRQSVVALRQVPAKRLFQKVPRLVRDVASARGKDIQVVLVGEELGLDKAILDLLDAPLVHLVRNAADHGIELPSQRVQAGKSRPGTIQVSLNETDTALCLTVQDDGGGLDLERIKAKAVETGLITANASLSREDIINFIFASGVSTASEVTDVSGRGVGLDVVRKAIESAGGSIDISSQPGQGTTFKILVPKGARTQILAGFLVGIDRSTFILPLDRILRAVAFSSDQLRRMPEGGERLLLDGATLGHHRLADLTGQVSGPGTIAVILKIGKELHSIAVDAVLGVRQVLVRQIEGRRCGAMVAGGAVVGDGTVAVVLDPDQLLPTR